VAVELGRARGRRLMTMMMMMMMCLVWPCMVTDDGGVDVTPTDRVCFVSRADNDNQGSAPPSREIPQEAARSDFRVVLLLLLLLLSCFFPMLFINNNSKLYNNNKLSRFFLFKWLHHDHHHHHRAGHHPIRCSSEIHGYENAANSL
jgi:hypothetical protein